MRHYINISLIVFVVVFQMETISGQGCSDAGFCTMGAMKPNQSVNKQANVKLRSLEFTQYYGYIVFDDIILSYIFDLNVAVGKKNTIQMKLPYTYFYGHMATTRGFGDISLSFTRNIVSTEKYQINASLGAKIPTNNANKQWEGKSLPMYYQTSLGTYDIIAGASFITRKWLLATGIQYDINRNGNTYLWGPWLNDDHASFALKYPKSNDLKRGTDIMFRVERNFRFSRFNTYFGILSIFRITPDQIVDPSKGGNIKVSGSTGGAITALYGFGYSLSTRSTIKFMVGLKLKSRYAHNADGLSRDFVNNITYEFKF